MARMSTDLTDNSLSFYALASGPVPSPFEKAGTSPRTWCP